MWLFIHFCLYCLGLITGSSCCTFQLYCNVSNTAPKWTCYSSTTTHMFHLGYYVLVVHLHEYDYTKYMCNVCVCQCASSWCRCLSPTLTCFDLQVTSCHIDDGWSARHWCFINDDTWEVTPDPSAELFVQWYYEREVKFRSQVRQGITIINLSSLGL